MIRRDTAPILTVAWASIVMTVSGCGPQSNPDDSSVRVQELEKRVAELESAMKKTPRSVQEMATTKTETNLVGNWVAIDDDRKVDGVIIDLKLKADGTGKAVINHQDPLWNNMRYDLVGKQLQLRDERAGMSYSLAVLVQSVNDAELVLEYKLGETVRSVRYTRDK